MSLTNGGRHRCGRQREGPVVDDAFHHDRRRDPHDAWQAGQLVISQGRIFIQVGRDDAEQVVGIAEQPLRVPDLRDGGDRGFEGGHGGGVAAFQRDADDGLEAEADGGRVKNGAVAGDDAGPLELAQPPVARRGVSCTRSASSVTVRRPSS